jgi:hypothetical protein
MITLDWLKNLKSFNKENFAWLNDVSKVSWKLLGISFASLLILLLTSCNNNLPSLPFTEEIGRAIKSGVVEVSPPEIIESLHPLTDVYQPQIKLLNWKPNQVINDDQVTLKLQVKNFPLFRSSLGLGYYLQVILDNQLYTQIDQPNQPLVLSGLTPGSHTVRIFACRPWGESYKNDEAYVQTSFSVFTSTPDNQPHQELPLLTYHQPQGEYGTQPIILDYYLANAPLHLLADQQKPGMVDDWRIRVTVNGSSFITDQWQPMYLTGFKTGKNWLHLEFIDGEGRLFNNTYNNTARLITYNPDATDNLTKLLKGEIPFEQAREIVDPNYKYVPPAPPAPVEPEPIILEPEVIEKPAVLPENLNTEENITDNNNLEEIDNSEVKTNISQETTDSPVIETPETETDISTKSNNQLDDQSN